MPALRHHLQTMARYEAWATRALLRHVDALPDVDYRRDAGLFFRSVHGTLNHLLLAGRQLWFERFANGSSPALALDAEVETDRGRLRASLLEASSLWGPWLATVPDERLERGRLEYVSTKGVAQSLPFAAALGHVFNHGTHHRGQVTAAITAMGHACPELDLVWMLQEEARAA